MNKQKKRAKKARNTKRGPSIPAAGGHRVAMRKIDVHGLFTPTGRCHVVSEDSRSGYFLCKSETSSSDNEEEIFISHNCVVWSAAGCVKKTFSLEQPIKQAIWASFTPNAPKTDLCILHTDGIRIFSLEGTVYNVTTPTEIERMWPLPMGLLLERATTLEQTHNNHTPKRTPGSSGMPTRTGSPSLTMLGEHEFPTLFSLLHPLDELKPVSFVDKTQIPHPTPAKQDPITPSRHINSASVTSLDDTSQSETNTSIAQFPEDLFVCQPKLHLVFSTGDVALMATFDERDGCHSVWLLRQQERDEDNVSYQLAKQQRDEAVQHQRGLNSSFPTSPGGIMMMGQGHEPNILTSLGLEDDELVPVDIQIKSDIFLEKIYQDRTPRQQAAHKVFLLAAEDGELVLGFFFKSDQLLQLCKMSSEHRSGLTVAKPIEISCKSVVPIHGVLPPITVQLGDKDLQLSSTLVVLDQLSQLHLFSLDRKICALDVPRLGDGNNAANASAHNGTDMSFGSNASIMISPIAATPVARPRQSPVNSLVDMSPDSPFARGAIRTSHSMSMDMDMDMDIEEEAMKSTPARARSSAPSGPVATPDLSATPQMLSSVVDSSSKSSRGQVITELTQPVYNRFSFQLADGRLFRASVSLPTSYPPVTNTLRAIQSAVPQEVFYELLSYFIQDTAKFVHTGTDAEWHVVRELVLSIVAACVGEIKQNESTTNAPPSAWNLLLQSSTHSNRMSSFAFHSLKKNVIVPTSQHTKLNVRSWSASIKESLPTLLLALHLTYEDAKLDNHLAVQLPQIGALLLEASTLLQWDRYIDYYARELPQVSPFAAPSSSSAPTKPSVIMPLLETPPSIFSWLSKCMQGEKTVFPRLGGDSSSCNRTRQICRFYLALFHACSAIDDPIAVWFTKRHFPPGVRLTNKSSNAAQKRLPKITAAGVDIPVGRTPYPSKAEIANVLVAALAEELASPTELDFLPYGVVLPIREALHNARKSPPLTWDAKCFTFVGRDDLSLQNESIRSLAKTKSYVEHRPGESDDAVDQVSLRPSKTQGNPTQRPSSAQNAGESSVRPKLEDGTEIYNSTSLLRFAKDDRLAAVGRLVRSSKHVPVSVDEVLPEKDMMVAQQLKLIQMMARQLALTVGRGMFTLATDIDAYVFGDDSGDRLSIMTEPVYVPPLCLQGKLVGANTSISIDPEKMGSSALWPSFHNAVAAGLRIAPEQSSKISAAWLSCNKPKNEVSPSFAGILLALGLSGHLKHIDKTKVFQYLLPWDPLTSIALLLGLASCYYGTSATAISRLLAVHVPAFRPPSSNDPLDLPVPIQTASLLGIGLLFAGSNQRRTAEVLIGELAAPKTDMVDREAYSLSAGFALGLVCLGQGPYAVGLADLNLADRLTLYMDGGRKPDRATVAGDRIWHSVNSEAGGAAHGQGPTTTTGAAEGKSSTVLEGNKVNVHVTAPSAVMALAMMYMKTNDRDIAARLQVPDTVFLLEHVRPDVLLMRTTAKCIVLWDSIEPSEKWLSSQLPLVVRSVVDTLEQSGPTALLQDDPVFDTLKQSFINIWTGACFALGLRFAGSANADAAHVIRKQLLWFMKLQKVQSTKGDRIMMETCISNLALSYAMVMAGTGDIDAFRVLRKLRKRVGHELNYGHHMAIGMAIGLLFLGAGRHSLSTSNKAIAALLIAFYPNYPGATIDNRYHMQAYRHLYVLAVEERVLTTREVDSLALCTAPVDIYMQIPTPIPLATPLPPRVASPGLNRSSSVPSTNPPTGLLSPSMLSMRREPVGSRRRSSFGARGGRTEPIRLPDNTVHVGSPGITKVTMMTPCLLPPLEWIVQIEVSPERYWPVSLQPNRLPAHLTLLQKPGGANVLVKRKAGYLTYAQDPHSDRSLLTRGIPKHIDIAAPFSLNATNSSENEGAGLMTLEFVRSLTDDPRILAFAELYCEKSAARKRGSEPLAPLSKALIFSNVNSIREDSPKEAAAAPFANAILYDCLTQDKPDAIVIYMALLETIHQLGCGAPNAGKRVDNLKLALAYTAQKNTDVDQGEFYLQDLIKPDLLDSIRVKAEEILSHVPPKQLKEFLTTDSASISGSAGSYLSFFGIPPRDIVKNIHQSAPAGSSRAALIVACAKNAEIRNCETPTQGLLRLADILAAK